MLLGIPEVSVEQVGNLSLGLAGASGGMNEATIYVQLRSAVIRVTGFSPQGDPMADVVQVAKVVIAK